MENIEKPKSTKPKKEPVVEPKPKLTWKQLLAQNKK